MQDMQRLGMIGGSKLVRLVWQYLALNLNCLKVCRLLLMNADCHIKQGYVLLLWYVFALCEFTSQEGKVCIIFISLLKSAKQ